MKRTPLLLSIFLIATQAFACSDDGEMMVDDCEPTANPVGAFIFPATIYTGYNGRDDYTSAVSANFIAESWEVADTSIATVTPTESCQTEGLFEVSAILDIVSAGSTEVIARAGGQEFRSPIIVQTYTTEQYDAGALVYAEANGDGSRPSCGSCHLSANGADHTPLVTAYYPDEVLLKVITEGIYPNCLSGQDGTECECGSGPICYELAEDERVLSLAHDWQLNAEERDGVVAYLRSLRPAGF